MATMKSVREPNEITQSLVKNLFYHCIRWDFVPEFAETPAAIFCCKHHGKLHMKDLSFSNRLCWIHSKSLSASGVPGCMRCSHAIAGRTENVIRSMRSAEIENDSESICPPKQPEVRSNEWFRRVWLPKKTFKPGLKWCESTGMDYEFSNLHVTELTVIFPLIFFRTWKCGI